MGCKAVMVVFINLKNHRPLLVLVTVIVGSDERKVIYLYLLVDSYKYYYKKNYVSLIRMGCTAVMVAYINLKNHPLLLVVEKERKVSYLHIYWWIVININIRKVPRKCIYYKKSPRKCI